VGRRGGRSGGRGPPALGGGVPPTTGRVDDGVRERIVSAWQSKGTKEGPLAGRGKRRSIELGSLSVSGEGLGKTDDRGGSGFIPLFPSGGGGFDVAHGG